MCYQLIPMVAERVGGILNGREALSSARDAQGRASTIQGDANARIGQQIQQTAAANPEASRATVQQGLVEALKTAGLTHGGEGFSAPGAVSSRYGQDLGMARKAAAAENNATVSSLAGIDAPQYQRMDERMGLNNTGVDLSRLSDRARNDAFITQLKLARLGAGGGG